MTDYIIVFDDGCNSPLYATGKTQTILGKKYESFTNEKIKAKFYSSKKRAETKADKLVKSRLYSGSFKVREITSSIVCR